MGYDYTYFLPVTKDYYYSIITSANEKTILPILAFMFYSLLYVVLLIISLFNLRQIQNKQVNALAIIAFSIGLVCFVVDVIVIANNPTHPIPKTTYS